MERLLQLVEQSTRLSSSLQVVQTQVTDLLNQGTMSDVRAFKTSEMTGHQERSRTPSSDLSVQGVACFEIEPHNVPAPSSSSIWRSSRPLSKKAKKTQREQKENVRPYDKENINPSDNIRKRSSDAQTIKRNDEPVAISPLRARLCHPLKSNANRVPAYLEGQCILPVIAALRNHGMSVTPRRKRRIVHDMSLTCHEKLDVSNTTSIWPASPAAHPLTTSWPASPREVAQPVQYMTSPLSASPAVESLTSPLTASPAVQYMTSPLSAASPAVQSLTSTLPASPDVQCMTSPLSASPVSQPMTPEEIFPSVGNASNHHDGTINIDSVASYQESKNSFHVASPNNSINIEDLSAVPYVPTCTMTITDLYNYGKKVNARRELGVTLYSFTSDTTNNSQSSVQYNESLNDSSLYTVTPNTSVNIQPSFSFLSDSDDIKIEEVSRINIRQSQTALRREEISATGMSGDLHSTFRYPLHSTFNGPSKKADDVSKLECSVITKPESMTKIDEKFDPMLKNKFGRFEHLNDMDQELSFIRNVPLSSTLVSCPQRFFMDSNRMSVLDEEDTSLDLNHNEVSSRTTAGVVYPDTRSVRKDKQTKKHASRSSLEYSRSDEQAGRFIPNDISLLPASNFKRKVRSSTRFCLSNSNVSESSLLTSVSTVDVFQDVSVYAVKRSTTNVRTPVHNNRANERALSSRRCGDGGNFTAVEESEESIDVDVTLMKPEDERPELEGAECTLQAPVTTGPARGCRQQIHRTHPVNQAMKRELGTARTTRRYKKSVGKAIKSFQQELLRNKQCHSGSNTFTVLAQF